MGSKKNKTSDSRDDKVNSNSRKDEKEKRKSKKKSKKKSKRESETELKKGGVIANQVEFNELINHGIISADHAQSIQIAEANRPNPWTPFPEWRAELARKKAAASSTSTATAKQKDSEDNIKYVLPFPSLYNPYGYSSSYFNPSIPKPEYTAPIKNLVMPQYKDRKIETQIQTYRDYLMSSNTWNNLYYEKMMAYGLSRIPQTVNTEIKGNIKNYITAIVLYGMNKIISDYELRNLLENGVRDAVMYGENVKQGDSPVVIYKPYNELAETSAHPASITPEMTKKEKRKKKKSKKKKKLRKLQKIKEMELLSELKELLKQKATN